MEEQPREMLKNSINAAIDNSKRIQSNVIEDQNLLKQILDDLHNKQSLPTTVPTPLPENPASVRNSTDPVDTPTRINEIQVKPRELGLSERIMTCGSDIISTNCDEEAKFHVFFYFWEY